jgi:hypothetical protein
VTAAWALLILVVLAVFWIAGYDGWALATGHDTMSGQIATWLRASWTGALVIALWIGIPAGLLYHFFRAKVGG